VDYSRPWHYDLVAVDNKRPASLSGRVLGWGIWLRACDGIINPQREIFEIRCPESDSDKKFCRLKAFETLSWANPRQISS